MLFGTGTYANLAGQPKCSGTIRWNELVLSTLTPTAKLEIAAGTTTVAPLKLTAGTNLTGTQAGAIEYDGKTFFATPYADRKSVDLSSGVVTSDVTVANTTTETEVYSTSLAANSLNVGKMVLPTIMGRYSTNNGSVLFTIRIKKGNTTILTTTSTAANVTDAPFIIRGFMTTRSIGSSGTVVGHANVTINNQSASVTTTAPITLDTTTDNGITITIQWGAAAAGNTLTVSQGYTTFIN